MEVEEQRQPEQDKYLKPYERFVARMDLAREKAVEDGNQEIVGNIDDVKASLNLDRDVGRKMNEARKKLEYTSRMRKGASSRPEYSGYQDVADVLSKTTGIPKEVLEEEVLNPEKGLLTAEDNHEIRKAEANAKESKETQDPKEKLKNWRSRTRPTVTLGSDEPQKRLDEKYRRQDEERGR